jgi:hypothetical protein
MHVLARRDDEAISYNYTIIEIASSLHLVLFLAMTKLRDLLFSFFGKK